MPMLLLGILFLLPFSPRHQILLAIPAGIGLYLIALNRAVLWSTSAARLLLAVFLLLWIPPMLALSDAAVPAQALSSTLRLLAFLFAGAAVIHAMRERGGTEILYAGLFLILTVWTGDGLLQFFSGRNLLGYPLTGQQLTGVFHPNIRIGNVLAHLAPFYLEALRRLARHGRWIWLLVIPYATVILLAGSRTGWFTLLMTLGAYATYLAVIHRVAIRHLLVTMMALGLSATAAVAAFPGLQHRLGKTLALTSLEFAEADLAVAERIEAWRAALWIIRDNWLNGVGVAGFEAAAPDRGYVAKVFSHPHMFVLDITASAGLIGLLGYLATLGSLAWFFLVRLRGSRTELFAPWLAVALTLFPFNVHWGFYATFSSSLTWLILLIAFGMTADRMTSARYSST
jgi:O-antigen ligase